MLKEMPAAGVKQFLHIKDVAIKIGNFQEKWKIAQKYNDSETRQG